MEINKIWTIIPAYNEENSIINIVKKTKKYVSNVIVVDDGSPDKTKEFGERAGAIVLKHIVNLGKGAALKTGCDFAIKQGAKTIIVLDADAQHNPDEITKFLKNLKNCDIVFGYRKLDKRMPLILKFGNWFINKVINFLYNVKIKDSQCGYRAFTAKAYKKIRWRATDYSMESEMIAKTGKNKLKYKEVPIETIYSDKYKGTTIIDGIKIVFNMFLWKAMRR